MYTSRYGSSSQFLLKSFSDKKGAVMHPPERCEVVPGSIVKPAEIFAEVAMALQLRTQSCTQSLMRMRMHGGIYAAVLL